MKTRPSFTLTLWSLLPGVSRCGPAATAAYLQETSWYYDMARGWDGRVEHVGFPGEGSYNGWDCTGSYLLGYALPLKSLHLTGRKPGAAPVLSPAEVAETIAAGRGFTFQNAERKDWYAERKTEVLLAGLSSWSPAVRLRSSQAPSHRDGDFLPQILKLLNSKDRNSRYGACEAAGQTRPQGRSRGTARARLAERQGSVAEDAGHPDLGVYGAGGSRRGGPRSRKSRPTRTRPPC